ncbi:unnamed protein product [Moneuplotes crassus]|uniref:Endoplasmic reticulum oxidoreductin n=1 Tax=Euplotes crassus TaxID=5936 RepID=A0AAD1X9Y0_EUPCR|nr:unnamed protein product [Moneuplotes crassus]
MNICSIILLLAGLGIGVFVYFTTLFDQPMSYKYGETSDQNKAEVEPLEALATNIYKENKNINSLLKSLMTTKFFRIFRTNLLRDCEFFKKKQKCILGKCPVYEEEEYNITHIKTYIVNKTLDSKTQEFTKHIPIEEYVDHSDGWMVDEHLDEEGSFLDIQKNPERFTGYNGSIIWNEINKQTQLNHNFSTPGPHQDFLYRIVSGLHSSISTHISKFYLDDIEARENFSLIDFYTNYDIFYERVGKYPDRVKNLFYIYGFFLDALNHIIANLPHYTYYADDESKNQRIQNRMQWFGHYVSKIKNTEKIHDGLYNDISKKELAEKIKPMFRNVTELLNCIACDVCKFNARIQFVGVATMLKILFTEEGKKVVLSENELVGLMNTIFRLSNSIKWYEEQQDHEAGEAFFKTMMYCIALAIAVILIILAIMVHCISSSRKDEERVPLRMQDALRT